QLLALFFVFFFFQAEDGIRDLTVTGVQTCALPIWVHRLDEVGPAQVEQPGLVCLDETLLEGVEVEGREARLLPRGPPDVADEHRSEERRVGKECRARGGPDHVEKKERREVGVCQVL